MKIHSVFRPAESAKILTALLGVSLMPETGQEELRWKKIS